MVAGPRFTGTPDWADDAPDTATALEADAGRILAAAARELAARIVEVLELDDDSDAREAAAAAVAVIAGGMRGATPADYRLAMEALLEDCIDPQRVHAVYGLGGEEEARDQFHPDATSGTGDCEGVY